MLIKEIVLRQKESHLFKNIEEKMSLEIKNVPSKINSNNNGTVHLIKRLVVELKKDDLLLANFIIGIQCEVKLQNGEEFNEKILEEMIFPYFYSTLTQMFGEMNIPIFPVSILYNLKDSQ